MPDDRPKKVDRPNKEASKAMTRALQEAGIDAKSAAVTMGEFVADGDTGNRAARVDISILYHEEHDDCAANQRRELEVCAAALEELIGGKYDSSNPVDILNRPQYGRGHIHDYTLMARDLPDEPFVLLPRPDQQRALAVLGAISRQYGAVVQAATDKVTVRERFEIAELARGAQMEIERLIPLLKREFDDPANDDTSAVPIIESASIWADGCEAALLASGEPRDGRARVPTRLSRKAIIANREPLSILGLGANNALWTQHTASDPKASSDKIASARRALRIAGDAESSLRQYLEDNGETAATRGAADELAALIAVANLALAMNAR